MSRARTIAIARALREIGPVGRRRLQTRRLPRQIPPDLIALEYFNAIERAVCAKAHQAFRAHEAAIYARLRDFRARKGITDAAPRRLDADPPGRPARGTDEEREALRLIDQVAGKFADLWRPSELHAVAAQFGKQTDEHQREQLDRQVRQAMGIPFSSLESGLQEELEGWAAQNVDLIVTIPERYFDRMRQELEDAFTAGTHPETLAKSLADDYDVSLNDARRIARDQIGKLASQVNESRQKSLGVTRATWRTMRDNRVCDFCEPKDGIVFEWDDPPDGCKPGECHPMDRCYGEPDFSTLLD